MVSTIWLARFSIVILCLACFAPVPRKRTVKIIEPFPGIWEITWAGVTSPHAFHKDGEFYTYWREEHWHGQWTWKDRKLWIKAKRFSEETYTEWTFNIDKDMKTDIIIFGKRIR